MNGIRNLVVTFSGAILFTFLFYNESVALNILLFHVFVLGVYFYTKRIDFHNKLQLLTFAGSSISALLIVIYNTDYSVFLYILSIFLFVGVSSYQRARSLYFGIAIAFDAFFRAQFSFLESFSSIGGKSVSKKLFKVIKIIFIPLIIIYLFVVLYSSSNPVFDKYLQKIGLFMNKIFGNFFENLNIGLIFTFILGIILAAYLFLSKGNNLLVESELRQNENLTRKRKRSTLSFSNISLKYEYRAGIFLFSCLNILLLVVNVIDINWVWFGFEWNGNYLKQFVHEGTYLLILSIVISMAITIYFFRANLNFFTKNKPLKALAYTWLAQNAVLTLSVAIRNIWYIKYFALAYKRIAVFFFLLLVLYGIFTIILKIRQQKSVFFLLSRNTLAVYIVLLFSSFFNWDNIIARYNFKNSDSAFLHLNFMATLSNKTLPLLDKNLEELQLIEQQQNKLFSFEEQFLTTQEYFNTIEQRKIDFKNDWENKSWISWNYADYKAYNYLFGKNNP